MMHSKRKFYPGFTLVELAVSIVISLIVILAVGVLFASGFDTWQQTYKSTHDQVEEDSLSLSTAFGQIGRMANLNNYIIYTRAGNTFTPVTSATPNVDTVVSGDAVEFRYWDVPLNAGDTNHLLDVTKTATAYALFYLDNGKIKVDYGPYNSATNTGAIPTGGGARNTANIHTTTLARNVTADVGIKIFSHTMLNGLGKGCIRVDAILTDPDGHTIKVMTSVLLRNMWPR
jgi:type II secretory pathway pseudopilin PulG